MSAPLRRRPACRTQYECTELVIDKDKKVRGCGVQWARGASLTFSYPQLISAIIEASDLKFDLQLIIDVAPAIAARYLFWVSCVYFLLRRYCCNVMRKCDSYREKTFIIAQTGNGCGIMPFNSPGGSTLQWGTGRFAATAPLLSLNFVPVVSIRCYVGN